MGHSKAKLGLFDASLTNFSITNVDLVYEAASFLLVQESKLEALDSKVITF